MKTLFRKGSNRENRYFMRQVGVFSEKVIQVLELQIEAGTPIYIGDSNIDHIKKRHPVEYRQYFSRIEEILDEPDYVGKDPKNNSIDYVKVFRDGDDFIQVSVRVTNNGNYFAKTLFQLMTYKAERYIEQGTLKKLDN